MKWIETTLEHHTESDTLYKKYRSSFVYAFRDAADAAETHVVKTNEGEEESSDDYVQKSEFRLLCGYLCIYTAMFDSFRVLLDKEADSDDVFGEKISLKDFDARREKLQGSLFHSLNMCASSSEFAFMAFREMDPDGNGAISLKDFCDYIKRVEIRIESEFGDILAVGDYRGMTLAEAESNIKQAVTRREWDEGRVKLLQSVFESLQMCAADENFADAAFVQMDSERNGRVSLRQFCHYIKMNEIKIRSEWGDVLAVGDNEAGAVSLAEANALMRKTVSRREWDEGRSKLLGCVFESLQMCSADESFAKTAFDQMDAEKNGRVTLEQFCHFIKINEIKIRSEWGQVLAVGDNSVGALSLAEVNALTNKTVSRREWDEGRVKLLRSVFGTSSNSLSQKKKIMLCFILHTHTHP